MINTNEWTNKKTDQKRYMYENIHTLDHFKCHTYYNNNILFLLKQCTKQVL